MAKEVEVEDEEVEDGPSQDRIRSLPKRKSLEEEIYDENGKMTYQGARKALAAGHSVMIGVRVINHPTHLPTEAEFAGADVRKQEAARANLLEQKAAIEAQIASLGSKSEGVVVAHSEDPALTAEVGGHGKGDTGGASNASKGAK